MASRIFTIGYGNKTLDGLVERLRDHGVTTVIDVRSAPYSKNRPEFSYSGIGVQLERFGLQYAYLGDRLGGKPSDPELYVDGVPNYEAMRSLRAYAEAIEECRLRTEKGEVLALLCGCSDASICHRGRLLSPSFIERGWEVSHIDIEGGLIGHGELMAAGNSKQPSLFGELF